MACASELAESQVLENSGLRDGPILQAERAGFDSTTFRKLRPLNDLQLNLLRGNELALPRCSQSFPVVAGHGGFQPGQNRDTFEAKIPWGKARTLLFGGGFAFLFLACITLGVRKENSTVEQVGAESEDNEKLVKTRAEIGQLVAEYHAKLPREKAKRTGALYARYSTKHQDSVADQVRTILDDAVRKEVFIPLEHIYFDLGMPGYSNRREGLESLRKCLAAKSVQVVFFFSTSRLYRKMYQSIRFVEEEVVERGIRAVFVKSGIDTDDAKRWKMTLNMFAMQDEAIVGMYADNIRAANIGLLMRGNVFGTLPFGYHGEVHQSEMTRRNTPRRKIKIDEKAAEYVKKIFHWFLSDRLSRADVVRRLNADPNLPQFKKLLNNKWSVRSVSNLLQNPKYRGEWAYGKTEAVWQGSKDYVRQIPRNEPLEVVQREDLRIVSDQIWYAVQARIESEVHRPKGRKPKDGDTVSRPRVLGGLFYCPTHNRPLYVAGNNGKWLACKFCRETDVASRPLFSQLCRVTALKRTCEVLAQALRDDDELVREIIRETQSVVEKLAKHDPAEIARMETQIAVLKRKIHFLLDNIGETDAEREESGIRLNRFRAERNRCLAELAAAKSIAKRQMAVPTEHEVRALISNLKEVLLSAINGPREKDASAVRAIIDLLTGGRIDLEQVGERRHYGGHLRGRFRIRLVQTLSSKLLDQGDRKNGDSGEEITIDYRNSHSKITAEQRDQITQIFQAGKTLRAIGHEVGLDPSSVRKILREWHLENGVPVPNMLERRKSLLFKTSKQTKVQKLADQVHDGLAGGITVEELIKRLGVSEPTILGAWRFWFQVRSLPVQTVREWQKSVLLRSRKEGDRTDQQADESGALSPTLRAS